MLTGRETAQAICDWIVRYAKYLEEVEGNFASAQFFSFAGTLQAMIDDGVYGEVS